MSAHVLLNLLSKLRKRVQMQGLLSILSLLQQVCPLSYFSKLNNIQVGTGMLDSIFIKL